MKGRFLLGVNESIVEGNIFSDKSSLILDWLLSKGFDNEYFSLRQVARECGVSLGLVQKVFNILVMHGFLKAIGVRTSKRFSLHRPKDLLKKWREEYNIVKKCKMWTYRSGFSNREEILEALKVSNLSSKVALALHSAVECYGCKNTNLSTLELYILDKDARGQLEQIMELEEQERGYEVLLIEPYYKSIVNLSSNQDLKCSTPLLTYLDLYHFPLRGLEQAEFMEQRIPELKRIRNQ